MTRGESIIEWWTSKATSRDFLEFFILDKPRAQTLSHDITFDSSTTLYSKRDDIYLVSVYQR